jgi:hypothetical protein
MAFHPFSGEYYEDKQMEGNMSKHTAGPWNLVEEQLQEMKIISQEGRVIADVFNSDALKTNLANARLIASAPNLLEALKVAQVRIFMLEGTSEAYDAINKVLDKAEGR